jgi:hypothetical protein
MTGLGKSSIEVALLAEAASVFKSSAHRLEKELAKLHAFADEASRNPARLAAYADEWKRVEALRHDLMIQREAMGMMIHDQFLEIYALPPKARELPRIVEPPKPPPPAPPTPQKKRWFRRR